MSDKIVTLANSSRRNAPKEFTIARHMGAPFRFTGVLIGHAEFQGDELDEMEDYYRSVQIFRTTTGRYVASVFQRMPGEEVRYSFCAKTADEVVGWMRNKDGLLPELEVKALTEASSIDRAVAAVFAENVL